MKAADVTRWTPLHWILIAVAILIAIVAFCVVANGLGFKWDPLNLAEKRADRAVASASRAKVDASARRIETAGAKATTRTVERAATERAAATEIVHRYALQLEAEDHAPELSPNPDADDGADLRDVLGELCDLRPAVCANPGHAAQAGTAGDGSRVVPDPAAAGRDQLHQP